MFQSQFAHLIWDKLYTVKVPDIVTQNTDYLRLFGVRISGNRNVDKMMSTNYITVMLPVIKLVEYFEDGVNILVPDRQEMIQIHKDIQCYLSEWHHEFTYSINLGGKIPKELLISLEKFSRYIYEKATALEVIDDKIKNIKIGLTPRLPTKKETEQFKPDYNGIMQLVKQKTTNSRY